MKESIKIMRDLLLVRKIEQKAITAGGIYLPSIEENDEPKFWDVLAVGKKVTDVSPGDKILTHNHVMGQIYIHNGEECMIIRYENAFGIFIDGTEGASVY